MMLLPIDTSRLQFLVAAPAERIGLAGQGGQQHARGSGTNATQETVWRVALVALHDREAQVIRVALPDDPKVQRGEMATVEGLGASVGRTSSRSGARFYATAIRPLRTTADACRVCAGAGTCRSCAQRRKHAWRLTTEHGLSYEQAAQRMGLTPQQVRLLAEKERDRLDLKQYKLDTIPTERVRAFVEQAMARDPELTRAELARRLGMREIDLDRQLGYQPDKRGSRQRSIRIEAASRIVIALGRAPIELEGC